MEELIISGILIAILVAILIVRQVWLQSRSRKLARIAQKLGLEFSAAMPTYLAERVSNLNFFQQGEHRRASLVIHGELDGVQIACFDYRYNIRRPRGVVTRAQTILLFYSERLDLPLFELRYHWLDNQHRDAFDTKPIDFPGYSLFTDKYRLTSPDEQAVRTLFTDQLIRGVEVKRGLSFEGHGRSLIAYRRDKLCPAEHVISFIVDNFPLFDQFTLRESTPAGKQA